MPLAHPQEQLEQRSEDNLTKSSDEKSFTVAPNPAMDKCIISIIGDPSLQHKINILDMNLNTVYSRSLEGASNMELNTHDWPSGLYLIEVIAKDGNRQLEKVQIIH